MTSMAERLAGLTAQQKRELLAAVLTKKAARLTAGPARSQAAVVGPAGPTAVRQGLIPIDFSHPNLEAEVRLDESITFAPLAVERGEPTRLLLTGATGFLGAFLLAELLERTAATVHCLVRAASADEGLRRIADNLRGFGLWRDRYASRIVAVPGDLAQPRLGLSEDAFAALAEAVDAIYHNGAVVNFVFPYHLLRDTNVQGTQEVLRLAGHGRTKPVHLISSVGIFASEGYRGQTVPEEELPRHGHTLDGGYAQSKWVADRIALLARERGLPIAIYRLGLVTGDSRSGTGSTDSLVCRLLKGCVQLGAAPEIDALVEIVPADFLAAAVVHLSHSGESLGRNFHLVNPRPLLWNELVDWMRLAGYPLRPLSLSAWKAEIIDSARQSADNAMYPLVTLLQEAGSQEQLLAGAHMPQFSCANMLAGLGGSGIVCPAVDGNLLRAYFSCFVRSGFISAPPTDEARPTPETCAAAS